MHGAASWVCPVPVPGVARGRASGWWEPAAFEIIVVEIIVVGIIVVGIIIIVVAAPVTLVLPSRG